MINLYQIKYVIYRWFYIAIIHNLLYFLNL